MVGRIILKIIGKIFKIIGLIIAYTLLVLFIFGTAAGVSGVLFAYNKYQELKPEIDEEVARIETTAFESTAPTQFYYWNKNTQTWDVLETLFTQEQRQWLTYDEIPQNLINCAVAIEDKTFWKHKGINWTRTIEATFNYVVKHQTETAGGSTITQQVIKNLTGNRSVNATRKLNEILEALSFEQIYSKEQILELYLNNIYLGSGCYGVYAASHKYFNKDVSELTLLECACLISITNNPSYYDPYRFPKHVKYRAALVIHELSSQGYISESEEKDTLRELGYKITLDQDNNAKLIYCEELDNYKFKDGSPSYEVITDDSDHVYSWYVDAAISAAVDDLMDYYDCDSDEAYTKLYNGGLSIYTAFDPDVQKELDDIYSDETRNMANCAEGTDIPPQSAAVVIDNNNAACIAIVGGTGEKPTNRCFSRATDMLRQPGSSIKPLSTYAPSIEEGIISEYDYVEDSPFSVDSDGNGWPINAYGNYSGMMSIKEAVIHSSNTVAVKTLDELGIDNSYNWLVNKFRLTSITDDDKVHSALALGGLTRGVSVFEMTNAFSVFARNGVFTESYFYYNITDISGNVIISKGNDADKILSESTVEQMDDMMYNVVLSGTATNADVDGVRCAGKTGTTTSDKDVWFCGYTSQYTVGVWTGYDDNQVMGESYPNPSCDTWHDIIERIVK